MSLGRHFSRIGQTSVQIARHSVQCRCHRPTRLVFGIRDYTKRAVSLANSLKSPSSPLSDIHKSFHALITELKDDATNTSSEGDSLLTQEDIINILTRLAESGRPFDIGLMDAILTEMSASFGVDPKVSVHSAIIDALSRNGDCRTLYKWLQGVPRKAGNVSPSRTNWHTLIEMCGEKGDKSEIEFVQMTLNQMKKTGSNPNVTTCKVAITAYFGMGASLAEFSALFDNLNDIGVAFDMSVENHIIQAANDTGNDKLGVKILEVYRKSCRKFGQPQLAKIETKSQLEEEARKSGVEGALRLFRNMQGDSDLPLSQAMGAMLQHSKSVQDLELLESELGYRANFVHWSVIIRNCIRHGDIAGALSVYTTAKKAGIHPDAAMVDPLMRVLCRTADSPPSDENIDQAYYIYRDLVDAEAHTPKARQGGPDVDIYQLLLRAMAASPNFRQYYDVAMSLLEDMQARNLVMNNSMTATSIVVIMMRNSSSFEQAHSVYSHLHTSLDAKGYEVVLNAFCKLPFDALPSVRLYFDIVRDMRRAGHKLSATVYTIILQQFSKFYTQPEQRNLVQSDPILRQRLVKAIRRAHDFLTLDGAITPDAALWNQLMDTYQRAGCFGDAYRVWDMIYVSNQFDHTSVSIILDACGYSGSLHAAVRVKTRLEKDGFMFNQRNWHTWIECMCRLGRLDLALKALCMDMGKDQKDVKPDALSVDIMRSFGRKEGVEEEIIIGIKKYLPELWKQIANSSK